MKVWVTIEDYGGTYISEYDAESIRVWLSEDAAHAYKAALQAQERGVIVVVLERDIES